MEIVHDFPQTMVVGVDILPPPEDYRAFAAAYDTPTNYRFIQHDILTRLPFADSSFDVCHMRMVYAAIPANRWQSLLDELARVTCTGGWIELVEGDILYFADEEQAQATRLDGSDHRAQSPPGHRSRARQISGNDARLYRPYRSCPCRKGNCSGRNTGFD